MLREEKNHRTGEGDGRTNGIPHDAVWPHQNDTEDEVRHAFNQHDVGPRAVFCQAPECAPRGGLRQHESGGIKQNQQDWVTGGNILWTHPGFDNGLAENG